MAIQRGRGRFFWRQMQIGFSFHKHSIRQKCDSWRVQIGNKVKSEEEKNLTPLKYLLEVKSVGPFSEVQLKAWI